MVLTHGYPLSGAAWEKQVPMLLETDHRLRVRAALYNATLGATRDANGSRLRADVLTAAQIGMMITSRMDPERAADLADQLAADIQTW